MRKLITLLAIIVLAALMLSACDPCFWAAGHPSRQCIYWQATQTAEAK